MAVLSSPGQQDYPSTYALQIFDLRNKLIAISVPLPDVSTVTSSCKDTQCENILDVRTMQLGINHCIVGTVVPLNMDNLM